MPSIIEYKSNQPSFAPSELVDWAEVRGNYVHVSQNGFAYKSGPYPSSSEAEIAMLRLKFSV